MRVNIIKWVLEGFKKRDKCQGKGAKQKAKAVPSKGTLPHPSWSGRRTVVLTMVREGTSWRLIGHENVATIFIRYFLKSMASNTTRCHGHDVWEALWSFLKKWDQGPNWRGYHFNDHKRDHGPWSWPRLVVPNLVMPWYWKPRDTLEGLLPQIFTVRTMGRGPHHDSWRWLWHLGVDGLLGHFHFKSN